MNNEDLNDSNFLIYAAKWYDNPQCFETDEFLDDLKRFVYLKRLFGKYHESGELKERLILNHIIVLYNIFGFNTTRMLFYKIDDQYYKYLKPFLILLGHMPETIHNIKGQSIKSTDISLDQYIVDKLRKI